MKVCCLDLEGVLLPEMWVAVAKKLKLKSLNVTTRDIPDYDELMTYRLNILKKEKIKLKTIQNIIAGLKPLQGAKTFIKKLQAEFPVIILSDTFYEFAAPLMKQLDNPTLFCNSLKVNRAGFITHYVLRQRDGKRKAVQSLQKIGFEVVASGDSYNDLTMLQTAEKGVLFNPPNQIKHDYPQFKVVKSYSSLFRALTH